MYVFSTATSLIFSQALPVKMRFTRQLIAADYECKR